MSAPENAPNADKSSLRTAAIQRREALGVEQRAAAAQAMAAQKFPVAIKPGAIVSGYWPIRAELDPLPLMRQLEAQGAQLALPVIMGREQPLIFRAWNADAQLLRGQFGIMEPSPQSPAVLPDIVLVPLAAFDRLGHRIGYGAGHYDRTFEVLHAAKPIIAIGVAFAVQEIDTVPAEPHDVQLDYVLTEARTFDFRSL
ncbi:5-formyltetrahydrofolate cyclo-ligase [Rhodopseudomonas sp. P2A-2r]|uniref:5-formyltetrahydrofolate cyclo-ligase n=1 Tax=Rhodopseudomonas sp. P2A-2r TaxID=2991972 RepID=UPI002233FD7E|nr:5-formyltetrahydrofolate cyclo-ligase [Rhodopseudomonas sp. P2A-2r]UZE48401.1 5-formyltetrahydrofolate cyclo-ligase [Rhodopseudomonas sp. P2A-2r]